MEWFGLGALVMTSLTIGAALGLLAGALFVCAARQRSEEEVRRSLYETSAQWEATCREVMRGIWGLKSRG